MKKVKRKMKYGLGGPSIVPGTKYIGRGEYPGSVNPDGTVSNEVSTSMEIDGKHYLLPTFWDGKAHTNAKEIRDRYNKTKEHLGVFDTPEDAERGAHYREFMNNQLSMKNGGKLPKYANGGDPPTGEEDGKKGIKYVSDPNDPALKAYNDSLSLYNLSTEYKNLYENISKTSKTNKEYEERTGLRYEPGVTNERYVELHNKINDVWVKHPSWDPESVPALPDSNYPDARRAHLNTFIFKKPLQPIKYEKPEPKTFGDIDPQPQKKMTEGRHGWMGDPKEAALKDPIKKGALYPRFALPSAIQGDNMRDIYEYNPKTGNYLPTSTMPYEDVKNMDIINKQTTESMRKDIERFLPTNNQKPKMGKGGLVPGYGVGGAIGTTVGTALNFIPGVGPMVSAIATPLLTALGDKIEDAYSPEKVEQKKTNEMNFTTNPYGFKKGGRIMADGGPVDPKAVYDYLISKGVSDAHAKGMLANIKGESNFNPAALGDKGTSGGLFQHHDSRFEALKAHAGEGWADNWQKQVDYALTEGDTKKYLSQTFKDASEASTWFTTNWERPSDAATRAAERVANLAAYDFGEVGSKVTTPEAKSLNFGAIGAKADTLPNLMAKKYLKPFEKGGDIPGKLIPLKQEGKFDKLGNGMFFAKGPSHKEGGIEADVAGPEGMDGIANIELEGKEILMDDSGYIVRKEIASKYISALKKMESKKDSTTNRTRDFMKNKMIAENEKMLQKENPNKGMMEGGGELDGKPQPSYNFHLLQDNPSEQDSMMYRVNYDAMLRGEPYAVKWWNDVQQKGYTPTISMDNRNKIKAYEDALNQMSPGKKLGTIAGAGVKAKGGYLPKAAGGLYLGDLINATSGQTGSVPPQPGFFNNYPVDPFAKEMTTPGGYGSPFTPNFGIGAGMNLNTDAPSFGTQGTQGLGMFGQAKGLNQGLNMLGSTGATNNPGIGGVNNQGGNKLGSTVGDYAQLAGIAVPAIYNLIKGSQDAEVVKPINNPREGQVDSLMANRRYNEQSTQNQITRAMNSGIGNINNSTNSASIRRSNVANLISNAEQQRASANLQGQQMNNQYAAEYASTANALGGQRVAAEEKAQQMNYLNRGAKDAYTSTAVTQIGQGLTEFGKMTNNAGYNNIALNTLNNAFPNYYFNTSIIKGMANGVKPSWMTEEEFQKAQTILYRN